MKRKLNKKIKQKSKEYIFCVIFGILWAIFIMIGF